MVVSAQGGKQTIDPPMSSVVECVIRKEDEVAEASGEGNAPSKEVEDLRKFSPYKSSTTIPTKITEKNGRW